MDLDEAVRVLRHSSRPQPFGNVPPADVAARVVLAALAERQGRAVEFRREIARLVVEKSAEYNRGYADGTANTSGVYTFPWVQPNVNPPLTGTPYRPPPYTVWCSG